jgi:hypothetical protein
VLKANLKVGEEYAVGASSQSWDLRRVELVEIDGERVVGEGDDGADRGHDSVEHVMTRVIDEMVHGYLIWGRNYSSKHG